MNAQYLLVQKVNIVYFHTCFNSFFCDIFSAMKLSSDPREQVRINLPQNHYFMTYMKGLAEGVYWGSGAIFNADNGFYGITCAHK